MPTQVCRHKLSELLQKEREAFIANHPKAKALFARSSKCLLSGVPMHWMIKVPGAFPIFVQRGEGCYIFDVDGHKYVDFCLGDTGSMTGHTPDASILVAPRVQPLTRTGRDGAN
jgi:glutamate-1-semialdehyde 2,1-aminomutase